MLRCEQNRPRCCGGNARQLTMHDALCLAACCLMLALRSLGFCIVGIFTVEFREYFRWETMEKATWFTAVHMGPTVFVSALVIGCMLERLGAPVTLGVSVILGSGGLIMASCINTLPCLYMGYGFLAGWGFCSYNIVGNSVLQHSFGDSKNLATGLAFTCMSIGSFFWPPAVRMAIDMYSWQGALFLLAAINLNVLPFLVILPRCTEKASRLGWCLRKSAKKLDENRIDGIDGEYCVIGDKQTGVVDMLSCTGENERTLNGKYKMSRERGSVIEDMGYTDGSSGQVYNTCDDQNTSIDGRHSVDHENLTETIEPLNQENQILKIENYSHAVDKSICNDRVHASMNQNLRLFGEKNKSTINKYNECETRADYADAHMCTSLRRIQYTLFVIFSFSQLLNAFPNYALFLYIPIRCSIEGYTKVEAVALISIMCIVSALLRLVAGALGDLRRVNVFYVVSAATALCGLALVLSVFCDSFVTLAVFVAVFGMGTSFFVTLAQAVIERIGGARELNIGLAMMFAAEGLCGFTFPLSGWILDYVGSIDVLFVVLGISGLLGSVTVLIVGIMHRHLIVNKQTKPTPSL